MAYFELKIAIRPELRELLISRLTDKGCLGFIEEDVHLIAYFVDDQDIQEIMSGLERAAIPGHQGMIEYSCSLLPDQDWNEGWKKRFKPLDAGSRFTILPPWEKQVPGRINLIIDPGMAFGTGHHETTRSCLVLMERYPGRPGKNSFLDLGTGTGLLAIAASKLGYAGIIAVDTDPLATEAARMNMRLNRVTNIEVREGSIDAVPERFDCIAANILSGILIELAGAIAARLNTPGLAILSGILTEQADEVVAAMQKAGLTVVERYTDGKWTSLVAER